MMLRRECVTASSFGDIEGNQHPLHVPQVTRLLYSKQCETPAMQYDHSNEPVAHEAYIAKQHDEYNRTVFVSKTGLLATNNI